MAEVVINVKELGWFFLSYAAIERLESLGSKYVEVSTHGPLNAEVISFNNEKIPRHDPLLLQVVKEMGHKASDYGKQLEIVQLRGNRYELGNGKDRVETVREPGDIVWIEV